MGRPVDSQRSKLYKAENVLKSRTDQKKFDTIEEVQEYVRKIMTSVWWKKNYPTKTVCMIENGAGKTKAKGQNVNGTTLWMTLPRWARCEYVILHEMAHGIAPRDAAAHGREYAQILLQLVVRFMGKDAGKMLRASFVQHKVKYKPKRVMTPAQLASVERLKQFQKKPKVTI